MAILTLTIKEGEEFTGAITFVDLDEEGETVKRDMSKGFILSKLLKKFTGDEYSLGSVEVIMDFDKDGRLSQIEIYT